MGPAIPAARPTTASPRAMHRGSGGCEVHPLLADVSAPSPLPPVQAAPATVLTGFGSTSQRERLEQARAAARAAAAAAAPAAAPAPAAALRQRQPEVATRAATAAEGQPLPPPLYESLPSRVSAEAFELLHATPTGDRTAEATGVAGGGAGDAERAAPPQVAAAAPAAPAAAAPAAPAAPALHASDRSIGAPVAAALPSLHLKQARLLGREQAARPVAKALAELSPRDSSGRSSGHSSGDRAPVRELRGVGGTLVKKNRAVARRRAGGTLQSKSAQVGAQPANKSFRF